jgi:adenylate kinase
MLNLVLFGPPGAGKGTQADFLVEKFNLVHLSTGELLRDQIAARTPLGKEAEKFMDKGFLVPDSIVIEMIRSELQENKEVNGYVFDGFPRTVDQAVALDELMKINDTEVAAMLLLSVEKEELISRLLGRGKTSGRADDQGTAIIENRIQEYDVKTRPIKDYYAAQNKFYRIRGMGTVEEIAERLIDTVSAL